MKTKRLSKLPAPAIGRIVHFVLEDGPCAGESRPAIINKVYSPARVSLSVFARGVKADGRPAVFARVPSNYSAAPQPGTWRWPTKQQP